MNTATPAATTILNDTRKADALKRIKALGEAYAKGLNSKPELAKEVTYLAHEGLIDVDPKSTDIADIYAESFLKGGKKHIDEVAGANVDKEGTASAKQQISKLRQFAIAADALRQHGGNFQEVLERAAKRVNKVQDCKLSTYERLVSVARAQKDAPKAPLTDAEIDAACLPNGEEPQPKTEKTVLEKLVADMNKLHDGTKQTAGIPSEALATAIQWIETRINDLVQAEANAKAAALRASLMTRTI